jgi:hypothetical protein
MKDAPGPTEPHHRAAYAQLLIYGWRRSRPALWTLAAVLTRLLLGACKLLLALLIVFEEWGWRPLAELLGRLSRWRPWAAAEAFIGQLPPYAALIVFALPTLLLLPLKFLALLLIASNHLAAAGLLFVVAKLLATALIARLFLLTQPALMQIGWFATAHDHLMPWKQALIAQVHASWPWRIGRRCKLVLLSRGAAAWRRWRPVVLALLSSVGKVAAELSLNGRGRFEAAWRWLGRAMSR